MKSKGRPRNPVARSPLLRKGGVHQRSASARRRDERAEVARELAEWAAEEGEKTPPDQ